MTQKMAGKCALVTGAGSGIGQATAIKMASNGANVALFGRNMDKLQATADSVRAFGVKALPISVDVGELDAYAECINRVADEFGRLDMLVNNATDDTMGLIVDTSLASWRHAFLINADAAFVSVQQAFRIMPRNGGGAVVNVSSTCGMKALAGTASYSASKAAMQHFSAIAAMEGAPYRVRVNCVVPGWVLTEAMQKFARNDPAQVASIAATNPMGRLGDPDELAAGIAFLCSEDASYINGAALPIDGGHAMRIHTAT